jgi:DNA-binding MarR family transcriptional regulator
MATIEPPGAALGRYDGGVTAARIPATGDAASTCAALEGDLGWMLGAVFRSYAKAGAAATADVPGGPRGYQVLAAATSEGPGTQLALANQLGVDRTVMTYLLDDLERAGLIERRPDPADRRVRRVVATDRGRTVLRELDERLKHVDDGLLSVLDEPDRSAFRALLRRLAAHAAAGGSPVNPCTLAEQALAEEEPVRRTRRGTRGS